MSAKSAKSAKNAKSKDRPSRLVVARNRRARHDYMIDETFEAGLALTGTEVKSLRAGRASLQESHAGESDGELWLFGAHIPPYEQAAAQLNHAPRRPRKLLLHRRELNRILGAVQRKGVTLVPLDIHFNARGIAKLELALATGKKKVDKRETEKKRDWQRQKERLLKDRG